jgi:quinol-cytochrome oxidoreductase complex cytochrome b subunit
LLPFLITGLVGLYLDGSTNPLGTCTKLDRISFYPYFYLKDLFGLIIFFSIFIFLEPNLLGHPDNYIKAKALVTPAHIAPEWYFLPFYAILRSIPNKLGGVTCMGLGLVIFFIVPFLHTPSIRSPRFKPLFQFFY